MTVKVAFCRELHAGMRGKDVLAHKRALSRWNPHVYPWGQFSDYAGPYFMQAVVEYKRQHRLGTTAVLGQMAHLAMEKSVCHYPDTGKPAFDQRAIQLAADFCADYGKTPEQKRREAIVNAGWFWYAHRSSIAYSQYRPMSLATPPTVPSRWDCSGFVTACHHAAGAPDPNGLGYSGDGYTGTLIDHGQMAGSVSNLKPGDLIFYGYSTGRPGFRQGDPTHVAMYVGKVAGVESVLSMGSYPMSFYPVGYRGINQLRTYKVI